MISPAPLLSGLMLSALLTALAGGSVEIFSTSKPSAGASNGAPVVVVPLSTPAATLAGGILTLLPSGEGQITGLGSPVWARFFNSEGDWLMDADARLNVDTDLGQEVVITAPSMYPGAFVRITGGTFVL